MKVTTIILTIINYLWYTRHILEDLLLLIIIFTLLCEIGSTIIPLYGWGLWGMKTLGNFLPSGLTISIGAGRQFQVTCVRVYIPTDFTLQLPAMELMSQRTRIFVSSLMYIAKLLFRKIAPIPTPIHLLPGIHECFSTAFHF